MKSEQDNQKVVANNKKAFHDFHILDTVECGMVLVGTEVKSLRGNNCSLRESYARIEGGEVWLFAAHIAPYEQGRIGAHDPIRKRKLLLHRREIDRLESKMKEKGLTLVPLKIYFKNGRAKVAIGLAKGKQGHDKRRSIADRDMKRDMDRSLRERQKGV